MGLLFKPFHRSVILQPLKSIGLFCLFTLLSLFLNGSPQAHAGSLKDLIKRPVQCFLPSQIVPGQSATFTLRGKPGQHVMLYLSPFSSTKTTLPNGQSLRAGKAFIEGNGIIPDNGTLEIKLDIPQEPDILRDKQYVEAIVWQESTDESGEIVRTNWGVAEMVNETGPTAENMVYVGEKGDGGHTLIVPGSGEYVQVLRSLDQYNTISQSDRKKRLADDGAINRDRDLDRLLPITP